MRMDRVQEHAKPGGAETPPRSRRTEERVRASLRLTLPRGACGVTRDISASGVFFRTRQPLREGDPIEFSVLFEDEAQGRRWKLACHGWVVRIEPDESEPGVAARIFESKLELQG
jgi:hypothetical protein